MGDSETDEMYEDTMRCLARFWNPPTMSQRERFSKTKWLQWYSETAHTTEQIKSIYPPKRDEIVAAMSAIVCADQSVPQHASAPLPNLTVIALPELKVGKRHVGRLLHGRVCVKPLHSMGMLMLMEDSSGRVILVQVDNAVSSSLSSEEVGARFPVGANLTIKEPFFQSGENGFHRIKVDNPEDLLVNYESTVSWLDSIDLEIVNSAGNLFLAGEQWMKAIFKYSIFINETLRRKGFLEADRDEVLVEAYSNRAEARLRSKQYEEASADAGKALELNPNHMMSLWRKGIALHGLGLRKEVYTILRAIEQHPDGALRESLKASIRSSGQSIQSKSIQKRGNTFGSGSGSRKIYPEQINSKEGQHVRKRSASASGSGSGSGRKKNRSASK